MYGIDLGTTKSCIARLDHNGTPEVIRNLEDASDTLASAVYFESADTVVIGNNAKDMTETDGDRVVQFIKREIGKPNAPTYEFDGRTYTPVEISALILRRLKQMVEAQGDTVDDVVIACPMYFGVEERNAIKQAGMLAGMNVLAMINEPTAATLSYCVQQFQGERTILVYDLGGGAFDVAIIKMSLVTNEFGEEVQKVKVVATGGNDRLGGKDWDDKLFDYILQQCCEENGLCPEEIDKETRQTIRSRVERIKKKLSNSEKAKARINVNGAMTLIEISRQKFEELTADLVAQTMTYVENTLQKVGDLEIDTVLLVGGSTFMPMIRNAVEARFPGKVQCEDPDLAVAKGAAIYGGMLVEENTLFKQFDRASRSFGVLSLNDAGYYVIDNLIKIGTILPATAVRTYYTATDNMEKFIIRMFENMSNEDNVTLCIDYMRKSQSTDPADAVQFLSDFELLLPPNTRKGSPIEVTFRVDKTGICVKSVNLSNIEFVEVAIERKSDVDSEKSAVNQISNNENLDKKGEKKIYGIDLGMMQSCIARLDNNGNPEVIRNLEDASDTLASAVYFESADTVVIGNNAKDMTETDGDRVVQFIKREIGKPNAPTYEFDGRTYTPVEISALILRRLKQMVEAQGDTVDDVVIACPMYFGVEERNAIKQAGMLAGMNVKAIINEPIAAALSYCAQQFQGERTILVYDLGGTFDTTIIKMSLVTNENGEEVQRVKVVATGGNDELGGKDWDDKLFEYMLQECCNENGLQPEDIDKETRQTIRSRVERIKKKLSNSEKAKARINVNGAMTLIEISRKKFEELTADLVAQTMTYVENTLRKVGDIEIDTVLLVGGSTFMPMIRNALETRFPGKVQLEDPNLAVAKGAAIYGGMLGVEVEEHDEELIPKFIAMYPEIVLDEGWLSRSFGIGILNEVDDYVIDNLIKIDAVMPATAVKTYYTVKDNMEKFIIRVFENMSMDDNIILCVDNMGEPQSTNPADAVKLLGELELLLPPNTRKGSPIEVMLQVEAAGVYVKAVNLSSGEIVEATIKMESEIMD